MRLKRVSGPECPNCSCTDGEEISNKRYLHGKRRIKRECYNCGKTWTITTEPDGEQDESNGQTRNRVITYKRPVLIGGAECPVCGRFPCPVTSAPAHDGSSIRIRYHKCGCGWTGKSTEAVTSE